MTFEAMNASIPNPQQTSIPEPQKTLTAFFDTLDHAETAVDAVKAAGVEIKDIQLVEGGADESELPTQPYHKESFWEALKHLFIPDEDRHTYAEGLRRGGYLVTVTCTDANAETISEILNREGTVNLEERAVGWRAVGWLGSDGNVVDDQTGNQFELPDAATREAEAREQAMSPLAQERQAARDAAATRMTQDPATGEMVDDLDTFRAGKTQDTIRPADMETEEERAARERARTADPTVKRAG